MVKILISAIALICLSASNAWALVADDFNPGTAGSNPNWRFYDPYNTTAGTDSGESKLTFSGTNAVISVPSGSNHDLWKSPTNKAPRLLQTQSNSNFQIEIKIESYPTAATQSQGIVVQQNNNTFLRFDVSHSGANTPKLFAAFVNGSNNSATTFKSLSLPSTVNDKYRNFPKYLRVIRSGSQWTFRYSYDRSTWINVVTFNQALTVTEVGFFAGTSGGNPVLLSSVDYFMDPSSPINDNDTWYAPAPVINTWYGYNPPNGKFGLPGISQQWANVLGNVFSYAELSSLTYKLNNGATQTMTFGPDTHQSTRQDGRLVKTGDFNVEFDHNLLNPGANSVFIRATDKNNRSSNKTVTLEYDPSSEWPLPYTANWQSVNTQGVEKIAHVVDGNWKITSPSGIRTVQKGYDRAIAIGDKDWLPNYQVTVPFTLHSGLNGIGFAVGWQGHEGSKALRIGWPLQALAWIRGPVSNATLEIMTYGGLVGWEVIRASQPVSIVLNTTYILKGRSEVINGTTSRFYLKIWRQGTSEPTNWNLTADIPKRNGSVLLVAYNVDATFGNVNIQPVGSP